VHTSQRAQATAALYARMGFRRRTVEALTAKDQLTPGERELLADALSGTGRYRTAGRHWQHARSGASPDALARRTERAVAVCWIRGQLLRAERNGWSPSNGSSRGTVRLQRQRCGRACAPGLAVGWLQEVLAADRAALRARSQAAPTAPRNSSSSGPSRISACSRRLTARGLQPARRESHHAVLDQSHFHADPARCTPQL
jgi:hypothetical protein